MKRPFLWVSGAYIAGILLAWNKISLLYIALSAFIGWLLIYLFMFYIKKCMNYKDYFLWGLPILMLIGYLAMGDRMKPPDMEMAFEEKTGGIITGEITMAVKKTWGMAYYLKDNTVTLPDGSIYPVEEIIVNRYDNPVYKENYIQYSYQGYQDNQAHKDNQVEQDSQEHQGNQNHQKYLIGNHITVSGTIRKFSKNTNPGGFNEHLYYKIQNISYKVNAEEISLVDDSYSKFRCILNNIKEELIKTYVTILPENEAGTLIAMILGEKYLLEEDINTLYQENGISHILSISGLHISMIGAAIYFLLRKLRSGLLASTLISLIFVYSYGVLTNFSVSTNRAVVMYGIMLMARLIGKTFDILSALSLSALLILIQNPMELFQAGFLLSYGAVLGIALFLPCLNSLYEAKGFLLKGIYVSISAQIFTLPIVLYYFFQIPTYSVFINLIILPLTSLLMLTALAAGIAGIVSIRFGVFLAGGSNYILKFYEMVCRLGSNLPGNLITVGRPDNIRILLYFVIMFMFIIVILKYKKKGVLILIPVALGILIIPKPRDGLIVTMLDVGQGDGIFMETDTGTTYFIDGGSSDVSQVGRYRITPYLLSRGTDRLDYAIVTHTDADHISGLIELMEGGKITVKCLILPNTAFKNEAYYKLEAIADNKGIKLVYIVSGDMIIDGKMRMTVLHPPAGYQPASNNDYSTVLSINYGEFDMLLTGDIEGKGEKELTEYLEGLSSDQADYDVLKVAHHGSKNSTSEELLSIIKPEVSLISCGKNNRYDHPHEELLERLNAKGSDVVITYESGAISIETDGKRMVFYKYIE